MTEKKVINRTLMASIAITFGVIGFYVLKFRNIPISDETAVWGTFGDYFGGIVNPLVGIGNLVLLIFVSYRIAELDELRSARELSNQKKFARYSLQHECLVGMSSILSKVYEYFRESNDRSGQRIRLLQLEYFSFIETNDYLFQCLKYSDKILDPLHEVLGDLAKLADEYIVRKRKSDSLEDIDYFREFTDHTEVGAHNERVRTKLEEFGQLKSALLNEMKDEIES